MIKKILRSLGAGKFIDGFRANELNKRKKIRLEAWLNIHSLSKSSIHPSISFIGAPSPYDLLDFGTKCVIEAEVTFWISCDDGSNPQVQLKDNIYIGRNTYVGAYQPISIGSSTIIGAYCYIISANHRYESRDIPIRDQGFSGAPIVIGEDVWLGTHVVVLPGVSIGKGAIVAAGSIVNKNIPEYEIWGGTPAKFIKSRP